MNRIPIIVVALLAPVGALLLSCADSPSSAPPSSGSAGWSKHTGDINMSLREATSLAGITIPILKAPTLERSWGKPRISTSAAGHYSLAYKSPTDPFERLIIYGSPTPYPVLTAPPKMSYEDMVNDELTALEKAQTWRATSILGRSVRWFTESPGGGADGAYHSTEGFALSHPDGKTGYYRLVIETVTNAQPKRFQAASW